MVTSLDQIVLALVHVIMVPPVTLSLENALVQQDGKELTAIPNAHQELME